MVVLESRHSARVRFVKQSTDMEPEWQSEREAPLNSIFLMGRRDFVGGAHLQRRWSGLVDERLAQAPPPSSCRLYYTVCGTLTTWREPVLRIPPLVRNFARTTQL